MKQNVSNKLFRTGDVAKMLGITQITVLNWCTSGFLPCLKSGKIYMIPEEAISALRDNLLSLEQCRKNIEEEQRRYAIIAEEHRRLRKAITADIIGAKPPRGTREAICKAATSILMVSGERKMADICSDFIQGRGVQAIAQKNGMTRNRVWQIYYTAMHVIRKAQTYGTLTAKIHDLAEELTATKRALCKAMKRAEAADAAERETQSQTAQRLLTSIDDAALSIRTKNALRRENITTIAEMITVGRKAVKRCRCIGENSIGETDSLLATLGLSWEMDVTTILSNQTKKQ